MDDDEKKSEGEIEITEEMIEAGQFVLFEHRAFDAERSDVSPETVIRQILRASLSRLVCEKTIREDH